MTTPDLDDLRTWNAAQGRARAEYDRDGFAASRELALAEANGRLARHTITHDEHRAIVDEVATWDVTTESRTA